MAAACERNGSGQSLEDLLDNEGTTAALVFNAIMIVAAQPLTCSTPGAGNGLKMSNYTFIFHFHTLPAPKVRLNVCVTSYRYSNEDFLVQK